MYQWSRFGGGSMTGWQTMGYPPLTPGFTWNYTVPTSVNIELAPSSYLRFRLSRVQIIPDRRLLEPGEIISDAELAEMEREGDRAAAAAEEAAAEAAGVARKLVMAPAGRLCLPVLPPNTYWNTWDNMFFGVATSACYSPSPSPTPSVTPTISTTPSMTRTPSSTPSLSSTPSMSRTPSRTVSASPIPSPTSTVSASTTVSASPTVSVSSTTSASSVPAALAAAGGSVSAQGGDCYSVETVVGAAVGGIVVGLVVMATSMSTLIWCGCCPCLLGAAGGRRKKGEEEHDCAHCAEKFVLDAQFVADWNDATSGAPTAEELAARAAAKDPKTRVPVTVCPHLTLAAAVALAGEPLGVKPELQTPERLYVRAGVFVAVNMASWVSTLRGLQVTAASPPALLLLAR
jgi:hypothetical protein